MLDGNITSSETDHRPIKEMKGQQAVPLSAKYHVVGQRINIMLHHDETCDFRAQ